MSITAVGVVALSSYFVHIDYFPLFDLQATTSYLFAAVLVLALLLIVFAITLLVPYCIIAIALKTRNTVRGERRLTGTIVVWMGFGMLSLIGLSAGVLLAIEMKWHIIWGLIIGLAFSILLCALRSHLYVKKIKKRYNSTVLGLWKKKVVRKLFVGQLGIALMSSLLQMTPMYLLLLMFSRASGMTEDDVIGVLMVFTQCALFIAIVGGFVLHVIFIPRLRKFWWIAISAMLALPLILNGLSKSTGMLPMTMAQLTKIGNFRAEKLILSPEACSSIGMMLGIDCDEKTSPPIQLCNVHIMSRIGPETYLRIAAQTPDNDGKYAIRSIFLPTAQIASIQVNFEIKILRLDLIDADLGGRSSTCGAKLTTLYGDSAFDFNDFSLNETGKAQLLTFIQQIKNGAQGISEVKVTGHADLIGHIDRNAWLASRRAQEVELFLNRHLKNLAPAVTIQTAGKGNTQPLVKNCSGLTFLKERIRCEAPNRRVELEVISKERKNQP